MIRKILVVPVVLLCIAGALADTGFKVKISQNYPRVVKPGDEFTMTFNIDKSTVTGFAKLQEDLPEGFTAEAIETHGADFIFEDNSVKFTWIQLPAESEFQISYKIRTIRSMNGSHIIKGEFAYLDEGKTQKLTISPAVVNLENLTGEVEPEPVPEVVRQVVNTISGKNEYRVELTIHPNSISESAQFTDQIPANYTAELIDAHGAAFKVENNSVHFDWKKLPDEPSFSISYMVRSETEKGNTSPAITGVLVYGDDEATNEQPEVKEKTTSEDFKDPNKENTVEANTIEDKIKTENSQTPQTIQTPPPSAPVASDNSQTAPVIDQQAPVAPNGIVYRVQISATIKSTAKDSKWFDEKYHINSDVDMTIHEGWKKYLIGNFSSYKDAIAFRKETQEKISDAFIVVYQNGVRISMEDAKRSAELNKGSDIPSITYQQVTK